MMQAMSDPVLCGRRMFLAALMCASKYLQDRNFSNRAWSKISGLPVKEVNSNERVFLTLVAYRLHVEVDTFDKWTTRLAKLADDKGRGSASTSGSSTAVSHTPSTPSAKLSPSQTMRSPARDHPRTVAAESSGMKSPESSRPGWAANAVYPAAAMVRVAAGPSHDGTPRITRGARGATMAAPSARDLEDVATHHRAAHRYPDVYGGAGAAPYVNPPRDHTQAMAERTLQQKATRSELQAVQQRKAAHQLARERDYRRAQTYSQEDDDPESDAHLHDRPPSCGFEDGFRMHAGNDEYGMNVAGPWPQNHHIY